jgi:hypothetical protein
MKQALLTALLAGMFIISFAQFKDSSIRLQDRFWSFRFQRLYQKMGYREVAAVMASNPGALALLKQARTNYTWGIGFGVPAAILLGYTLVEVTDRTMKPHWHLMIVGAGFSTLSTILYYKSRKQALEAADTYNLRFEKRSSALELRLRTSPNGAGLFLYF